MIPLLFEKDEELFNTSGLGSLPSWIEDTIEIHEAKNDEFFLQGELPIGALNVDQLAIDRFISAAPAPGKHVQPFRIRSLQKPPGSETVKVLAQHASYQLTEYFTRPNRFSTASAQDAMSQTIGQWNIVPQFKAGFTFESDIVLNNAVQYVQESPISVRAALGGVDGSLLDLFGGELEWDRWTVRLLKSRGRVTDKVIRYGQNLESLSFDTNAAGLVTGYYGWWRGEGTGFFTDAVVYKSNVNDFGYPRFECVDLSKEIEIDLTQATPTREQMLAALQAYADAREANHLSTSIVVTAVPEELQDVYLCDTVTVVHPGYDLMQTAKVVKTVFDPIKERYKEITIGEIQKDITGTIAGLLKR